jgi:hypothetical protein
VAPFDMVRVPLPDHGPDKPVNGAPEPGSVCPCGGMSKIADANSAALTQFADNSKEKRAMKFTLLNPRHPDWFITKPHPPRPIQDDDICQS